MSSHSVRSTVSRSPSSRRRFALALLTATVLVAAPAFAGSWLDRAALLLGQATRDTDWLRGRLTDRDLAEVVHRLASARLESARRMQVPKEVQQAHPHLLLVLEQHERAAEAATRGEQQRFLVYVNRAREEEKILKGVLKQLGWSLPKY